MTGGASLRHRAEYWALRGTVAALRALHWRGAGAFGAGLGALGYRPLGIRRGVVERQIAAAFPGLGAPEVARMALGAYRHLGRASIETALLPTLDREAILDLVDEVVGWELLAKPVAEGRGVIAVTGHVGNWELGGAYVAARGLPVEAIVRGMANPLFDRYLTSTRSRIGMTVVHDADAVRRIPRALREGHVVAILADQGVLGLASTFVPFFGRPAKTPRGPAVFALRLGAPVVFAACIRLPCGRYRLSFEEVKVEDTGDRDHDIDEIVARYTRALERVVRAAPEQYFWHHRRWRRQPPDTPPELREP